MRSSKSVAMALVFGVWAAACSADDGTGGGDPQITSGGTPTSTSGAAARAKYGCSAAPDGVSQGDFVGDQLPDMTVKDCDGNDVPLARFCGADALWLYQVHTWCPHCNKVGTFAESLHDSFVASGKKLVSVNIVVQNDKHAPPTQADCRAWRDEYGFKDNITLYDPTGVVKRLNDSTFTSLSVYADKDQVIRGKTHSDSEGTLRQGIEATLAASAARR